MPAHGGVDGGASGNGIIEKNLTLEISKYMYDRFKELGIPVALTRTTDTTLDASDRPGVALNKYGNGKDVIIISNHINAGGGEGAEVIYALRNKDTLSKTILEEIGKEGQVTRKYYQRRLPSDSSKDYYYMLRNTPNTESIIVEYGFLDNAKDAERLKNNYKDYAEAVVRAVAKYKNLNYVPTTGSDYYIVKKGDTLWSIARDNNITVDKLKEINNLTSNSLSIGDILKLTDETVEQPLPNDDKTTYRVKSGDTLYSISRKYNISINDLKVANNLISNTLSIGQVLIIPKEVDEIITEKTTYTVKSGDTLYSISKKYNISVNELKTANNLTSNTLSINQELIIPTNEPNNQTYTVKSGDTLYSIARKFNASVNEIKQLNNLSSTLLSIGQTLLIPN